MNGYLVTGKSWTLGALAKTLLRVHGRRSLFTLLSKIIESAPETHRSALTTKLTRIVERAAVGRYGGDAELAGKIPYGILRLHIACAAYQRHDDRTPRLTYGEAAYIEDLYRTERPPIRIIYTPAPAPAAPARALDTGRDHLASMPHRGLDLAPIS